jgi:excisionase family DNA binding protein
MDISITTPFIKVSTAAEILQVSNCTVYRMLSDGRLPAFRVSGGVVRIRTQDFIDFCNGKSFVDQSETGLASVAQVTAALSVSTQGHNRSSGRHADRMFALGRQAR